jgi:hypothetical protein
MTVSDAYNAVSAISTVQWLILGGIWLVTNIIVWFSFTRFLLRRQWKLYQHLKRPVVVFPARDSAGTILGNMDNEIQLLKDNGFLNISTRQGDYRSFDPKGKHCVVVLGYKSGMVGLDEMLSSLRFQQVPLIVYTYGGSIVGDDKAKFDNYPWMLMANFPLTLLNHIFATVASYPYEQRQS